jgi:hypothetical protein
MKYLRGPADLISPYADYIETRLDSRLALPYRAVLARRNQAWLPKLKALFERVYPDRSFGDYWDQERMLNAPSFPAGDVIEADGTVAPPNVLRGRWQLLLVWPSGCGTCSDRLKALEGIAGDFPGSVLVVTPQNELKNLARQFERRGSSLPALGLREVRLGQVGVPGSPVLLLLDPGSRYVVLTADDWETDVREVLTRNSARSGR